MTPHIILRKELEYSMSYPIGQNIQTNKPYIATMIDGFKSIEEFKDKYVNIICRGSSGAIIAGFFSLSIENEHRIVHIKKQGESSHNDDVCLRTGNDVINLIVDDFMCTGKTINAIYERLKSIRGYEDIKIDCLCISGQYGEKSIYFDPNYLICGRIGE